MSTIFGLFGSKKKENKKEVRAKSLEAIQNLKSKISEMEEKISFLETKKNHQNEIAKEKLKKGDKIGAKKSLATKKQFDQQIKVHDGAMMMMEEQMMMLQNAESLKDVFRTVTDANNAIKDVTNGMKVEDLDRIKDDMEDIKSNQQEVNEFFIGYSVSENEELDNELADMEREILKEELPDAKKSEVKPIQKELVIIKSGKNDDLNELDQFLN